MTSNLIRTISTFSDKFSDTFFGSRGTIEIVEKKECEEFSDFDNLNAYFLMSCPISVTQVGLFLPFGLLFPTSLKRFGTHFLILGHF